MRVQPTTKPSPSAPAMPLPLDWAMTQNNLGNACRRRANFGRGRGGQQKLNEAIEAYRLALTVRTRNTLPRGWADAPARNLGLAPAGIFAHGQIQGKS